MIITAVTVGAAVLTSITAILLKMTSANLLIIGIIGFWDLGFQIEGLCLCRCCHAPAVVVVPAKRIWGQG